MIQISDEPREKLKTCKSDVEVAKMLADNGVDVEEFQKSLPDEVLNRIGGGYKDVFGDTICCPWCNESESGNISYQVTASFLCAIDYYRCRSCNKFFRRVSYDDETYEMRRLSDDPLKNIEW
ncbi:MAG: hypothetical protein IJI66_06705 [Erysipelotrichaceae bacterium]|nr:hypothetical protein [Erysipelotrichaceae bacterium]